MSKEVDLEIALDVIARELQWWIDWEYKKHEESGSKATESTAIMCLPSWPSIRVIKNWILVLRRCEQLAKKVKL